MTDEILTREFRAFFDLNEIRESSRTVEASISSEFPFERENGFEVLVHSEAAIDFSRGPEWPLLLQHDSSQINAGIALNMRLVGNRLKATLKLGKSERSTDIWKDIQAGVLKFVSIAYHVIRKTEPDSTGTYYVTRWRPYEVSLVSVAADSTVGINRSGNLQTTNKRINEMSKDKQRDITNYWQDKKEKQSVGEFLQGVAMLNISADPQNDANAKRAIASGLSVSGDGILAPSGFSEKLLFGKYGSPLIKKILSLRVKDFEVNLPYATSYNRENGYFDSLQTYQISEADEKSASKPLLAALQYKLKKTVTLCYTSDELLEDSTLGQA